MPGVELKIVTLDAEAVDPLAEILDEVDEGDGPVMVLGLERAVPLGNKDAPVLRALNLERAEWPMRLRRPVVIWIPEAFLGILGRAAPDFLDWRSDTIHFPSRTGTGDRELNAFDGDFWRGWVSAGMTELDRRARIDELRSRLRTTVPEADPVVEQSRGSWLHEMGNHLLFLGQLDAAEGCYLRALSIAEEVGYRFGRAASYHQLGWIAQERGSLEQAVVWYRKSLLVAEELDLPSLMAINFQRLGAIAQQQGSLDDALSWYRRSLAISEELGDRSLIAVSFNQIGRIAQERGSLEEALEWYRKSLAIAEEQGNQSAMASGYHHLGMIAEAWGSFDEALDWYRKSIAISEELGYQSGMASTYHQLGKLAQEVGSLEEAQEWYRKSLAISGDLGSGSGVASTVSQLGVLAFQVGAFEEAVAQHLRSFTIRRELGSPELGIDTIWLRREREALGEERFRSLAEGHAESLEIAEVILRRTAEPVSDPAQEVAEPSDDHKAGVSLDDEIPAPADYEAGGRSDQEA